MFLAVFFSKNAFRSVPTLLSWLILLRKYCLFVIYIIIIFRCRDAACRVIGPRKANSSNATRRVPTFSRVKFYIGFLL